MDLLWPDDPEPRVVYHKVARREQVRKCRPFLSRVGIKKIVLFEFDGEVYATSDVCPHAGGQISHGHLDGCFVHCPRHDWAFDVRDGACHEHGIYTLTTYAVEVRDDGVYIGIVDDW